VRRLLIIATCLIAVVLLLLRQRPMRALDLSVSGAGLSSSADAGALDFSSAWPGKPTSAGPFGANPSKTNAPNANAAWDAKAAAAYLDQRAAWWMGWDRAQRDHETFCISCHTAVPYAMARSTLRSALGEQAASPAEQHLVENVTKRVRLWRDVAPFYSDKDRGEYKTVESRGTEAVLNALVLAGHDAQSGRLSEDGRAAFANMWAEQVTSGEQQGAWRWLRFKNEPWEADDSDFYGAALAAIATGIAPEEYRLRPEVQANLKLLRGYLNRQASGEPLMNRVVLLWAGAKVPGLVEPALERAVLTEVLAKQQPDGGWSLPSLAGNWSRHDNTPQDPQSDGYATGLIVYVLEQFTARDPAKPRSRFDGEAMPATMRKPELPGLGEDVSSQITAGRSWLVGHQNRTTGYWPSASLNKNEANHISPDTARFMNDAATAYAVLALSNSIQ
jgi:squalene-hopene/tetraprenyl-beta-curcumene cyclase